MILTFLTDTVADESVMESVAPGVSWGQALS